MNLPITFEQKMRELLQDDFDNYIKCYEEEHWYGLRVNTKKISVEQFLKICPFEIKPIPWIENGFYYDGDRVSPAKHPYYFAGLYYLQEPSAMTPASRLPIEPGDKVLDICAAPGGKATELGARLRGQGVLVANDISNSRAKGLLKNIEVFGIGNVLVISEEPGKLCEYFPEYFDKILIDAPCSGEGMFRKDTKMMKAWEEHGPEYFSKLQKSIITQAARMLKPGGMLLYSTCTFDPTENEGTITYLMQEYPEFEICSMEGYEGFSKGFTDLWGMRDPDLDKTIRIWPHKMQGEGHYLALLKKGDSVGSLPKATKKKNARKIPDELSAFLKDVRWNMDFSRLELYSEKVYYMPEDVPKVTGLRFLRTGLYLGDIKKNRFEPSQSFAMCLKSEEYTRTIDLSATDERVIRYLKGETIDVSELVSSADKGWQLVLVDGYPLGWGKLSGGILKNKYLPGWRWQSS